jgi:VRR-NUC domain
VTVHVAADWFTGRSLFADEAAFQDQLVRAAKRLGYRVYHTHDSRKSEPGFPDLVLVSRRQRRTVFAELKTPEGTLTEDQSWWIAALAEAGQEVHLWRYADWDMALATLAQRKEQPPHDDHP